MSLMPWEVSTMIYSENISTQLKNLNLRFRLFGRSEIKELRKVLQSEEKILHCVYGFYQGGSGILVATEHRVLLIDKRPFFVNIEDITFETLRHAELTLKSLQASLHIHDGVKKLIFRSLSDARLKDMKEYLATKIVIPTKQQITSVLLSDNAKPYLNPAWRPRHTVLLPRPRPHKYYTPNTIN